MLENVVRNTRNLFTFLQRFTLRLWKQYRLLKPTYQWLLAGLLVVFILILLSLIRGREPEQGVSNTRTVTVGAVSKLTGNGGSLSLIGSVRSITEAKILAQAGGVVRRLNAELGGRVGAGTIIAEIENSSESASVLQAEGVYEAAQASLSISSLQSQNSTTSFEEAKNAARSKYRSTYTDLDTVLTRDVDAFFGDYTPTGPRLLINPGPVDRLSQRRAEITDRMEVWQKNLVGSSTRDPDTLLQEASALTQEVYTFLVDLGRAANVSDSRATVAQLTSLASARASVDVFLASLSSARDTYNAKKTAAEVSTPVGLGGTASAQASVKQALGALRGAQANLEKTRIRAPIAGTVNFLPIRQGDYVTQLNHVATVAQNGALEIVSYIGEGEKDAITVGMKVLVEGVHDGIITSVSPALDPVTKQVEVRIAVAPLSGLLNGASVRITLAPEALVTEDISLPTGPVLLPLTAVKLRADERIVFTVSPLGRLVSIPVTIGKVRGSTIEILSPLPFDLLIVIDARGLAEGEKVETVISAF